jgi:aminoglycoside phosphotransferase family enzyme/predicted kinase
MDVTVMDDHRTLIESLRDPSRYDHRTESISVRETHISSIILTGPYAYKIKKPVKFDFLDFTTPEKRRYYCQRELELNRRLCPDLYRSVVALTGSPQKPRLGDGSTPFDYAVKMVQFDEENLLSRIARDGDLERPLIDEGVDTLAEFHEDVQSIPESEAPSPAELNDSVQENFRTLDEAKFGENVRRCLQEIQHWSDEQFEDLSPFMQSRRENGFVRDCHGDVHLGNIALHEGAVKIFDCIEFNEEYRQIDVINELAFLTMDLHHRNNSPLARRAVNRYVTRTGDHAGLKLLDYYRCYRAMVRAKIDYLDEENSLQETERYIQTAHHYTQNRPRGLLLTHGFSGTGKTTETEELIERYGAVRIRSDVERKRLAGVPFTEEPTEIDEEELYSTDMTDRTYSELLRRGRTILESNFPVVVDATFLKETNRRKFRQLAEEMNVPFGVIRFGLPEETIRNRLQKRSRTKSVSDAGVDVFEQQQSQVEPVSEDEAPLIVTVNEEGLQEHQYQAIRDVLGNESFRPKKTGNE